MRAFSYVWSLLVTLQRWRSHHSIRCCKKANDICKPHGSIFYTAGVTGERSLTFREWGFSTFLRLWPWPWPDDLHIRTWPVIPGDTSDVQTWTSYVKDFKCYRLTDRQTDRQTRPKLYTTSRVVNKTHKTQETKCRTITTYKDINKKYWLDRNGVR